MSSTPLAQRAGEEIWESNIPGRVFVESTNPSTGRAKSTSCVGKGSRLRISTLDRLIAEEGIRESSNNPFRNGMLTRVDAEADKLDGDVSNALTDTQLFELFALTPAEFIGALDSLTELNVRRLKEACVSQDATNSQVEAIQAVLDKKYPVSSGETPTWREMQGTPNDGVGAQV